MMESKASFYTNRTSEPQLNEFYSSDSKKQAMYKRYPEINQQDPNMKQQEELDSAVKGSDTIPNYFQEKKAQQIDRSLSNLSRLSTITTTDSNNSDVFVPICTIEKEHELLVKANSSEIEGLYGNNEEYKIKTSTSSIEANQTDQHESVVSSHESESVKLENNSLEKKIIFNEHKKTTRPREEAANILLIDEAPESKKLRTNAHSETYCDNTETTATELEKPRRSNRERKLVQHSEFVSDTTKDLDDLNISSDEYVLDKNEIIKGRGVKLGSISTFVKNFEAIKSRSILIRKLFKLLYGIQGKSQSRKDYIFNWSGLPVGVDEIKFTNDLSRLFTVAELKELGKRLFGFFCGAKGGDTKQAWIEVLMSVLVEPDADKIQASVVSDLKSGTRGNMTGYQLFCSEMRKSISSESLTSNNKKLIKLLASKWRLLTDAEKQKYQLLSIQRRSYGGVSPAKKRISRQELTDEEESTYEDEESDEIEKEKNELLD